MGYTFPQLANKKIVVTGGCGFIGINLVKELLSHKAIVSVLDLPDADWTRMPAEVTVIQANILDKNTLVGVFKNIDIIYHLAARADLDGKTIDDYAVNFEGTGNIIDEIANSKSKSRLVFYSTQLVVGIFNETRFINVDEPYKTKTLYGESKIEGEKVVIRKCKESNIPYAIIRPTSVYGPWGAAPFKEFFQTIKFRRYMHVGKANNLVSMCYVKNLIELTIRASLHDKAIGKIFFGTDYHPYTMREVVDMAATYYGINIYTAPNFIITPVAYIFGVFKLLGVKVPIYPFRLRNIKASYCYDIQNTSEIGYAPQYGLREGIKETLDWYESKNYSF
jgi:nucleoside-diphosphate-sugar epimerase